MKHHDPLSEYIDWCQIKMDERKAEKIAERVQTILAIRSLPLPYDMTKQMIISYKYDLKEKVYHQNYRNVVREIRKDHRLRVNQQRIRTSDMPRKVAWSCSRLLGPMRLPSLS